MPEDIHFSTQQNEWHIRHMCALHTLLKRQVAKSFEKSYFKMYHMEWLLGLFLHFISLNYFLYIFYLTYHKNNKSIFMKKHCHIQAIISINELILNIHKFNPTNFPFLTNPLQENGFYAKTYF